MSMIYTRLSKEMKEEYFSALKLTGVGGIVMPCDKIFSSNLIYAKNNGLNIWVSLDAVDKEGADFLVCDSSGIFCSHKEISAVSSGLLKEALKAFEKADLDLIDGFIIKYPKLPQLIWDESFRVEFYSEFSNDIDDYLYLLFEPAEKLASFRTWYYEKCADFVYKKYLYPLIKLAKRKGVRLCFDIGTEESEYFYIKRHIDIFALLEKGVSLYSVHNSNSIAETCIILSKYNTDSFVASQEADNRIDNLDINLIGTPTEKHEIPENNRENILLVRSARGVTERIIKSDILPEEAAENEAIIASFESTYYTDMLFEKGFNFEIASEKLFEKHTRFKNGELTYKNSIITQLLLCNSCVFSEKGIRLLNKIADGGICINNKNLINILASDLI